MVLFFKICYFFISECEAARVCAHRVGAGPCGGKMALEKAVVSGSCCSWGGVCGLYHLRNHV